MTSIRKVVLACTFAAAAMLPLTASAQSGLPNQDTFFTFSQPVELPDKTLPAGTYLFVLADGATNRHVVKVMSQDLARRCTPRCWPSLTTRWPSRRTNRRCASWKVPRRGRRP